MPRNSRLISRQGKPRKVAKRLAVTLFFVLFCFVWFFPILYIVNGSLKSSLDWATNPRSFFPDFGYTLDNFKILFVGGDQGGIYDYGLDAQPITAWILNSLFASLAHTFLYLAFAILAAYVFVFLDFKGKNALFSLLLLSMAVPSVMLTTPQFENILRLGLSLNVWSLILPGLGGISGVYLLRQFFRGIPKALIESAKIDGAGHAKILWKVVLPLAKSALFVQGLFSFMSVWNDYAWAQIVLGYGDKGLWTLQLGLTYLVDVNKGQLGSTGVTLAASLVSMLPVFIVYLFAENNIVEGVAFTGMKN